MQAFGSARREPAGSQLSGRQIRRAGQLWLQRGRRRRQPVCSGASSRPKSYTRTRTQRHIARRAPSYTRSLGATRAPPRGARRQRNGGQLIGLLLLLFSAATDHEHSSSRLRFFCSCYLLPAPALIISAHAHRRQRLEQQWRRRRRPMRDEVAQWPVGTGRRSSRATTKQEAASASAAAEIRAACAQILCLHQA